MIRVRRSLLDEFRKAVATPYGDEAALVRTIKGQPDEPNWQMRAGTAWHGCLEYTRWTDGETRIWDGFVFSLPAIQQAQRYIGPGQWEVRGSTRFCVGGLCVQVTGDADHLHGLVIQDQKTCFSPIDPEHYADSLQWRLYLLIHDCSVFRYNCWAFKEPKDDGFCELKGVESFRFWPYPGMKSDCERWVREFVAWCGDRNLLSYLEVKE